MAASRAAETPQQHEARREENIATKAAFRAALTPEEQERRQEANATGMAASRNQPLREKEKSAFSFNPALDYASDPLVAIGSMSITCRHCDGMKWTGEAPGICCNRGKVRLTQINAPPEPLRTLLAVNNPNASNFQSNIRRYNSCFNMTSFGTTKEIRESGYMPTFKVQGQVYHQIGSLQP